jgi:hypothetical protein
MLLVSFLNAANYAHQISWVGGFIKTFAYFNPYWSPSEGINKNHKHKNMTSTLRW